MINEPALSQKSFSPVIRNPEVTGGDRDFLGTLFPCHFNSLPRVSHIFCLVSFKLFFAFHSNLSFCKCKSSSVPLLSAILSLDLLAWLKSIQRAGLASAPSLTSPQEKHHSFLYLTCRLLGITAFPLFFCSLLSGASLSSIMLPTDIYLSSSQLHLSVWYWGALSSITMWSQDLLSRPYYKFLW